MLNQELLKQQSISKEDESKIEQLHIKLQDLKDMDLEDIPNIPDYVKTIEEIEFALQRLWKFEENESMHSHWLSDPKCSCPKLDNRELAGVNRRIISSKCKLHFYKGLK